MADRLADLLGSGKLIQVVGVHDGLSAILAERADLTGTHLLQNDLPWSGLPTSAG